MERPTLHTERLTLRPFTLADAPDVQRLAGETAIADTTLNIPHPYEDGMAEEWINTHKPKFDKGEQVNFAITLTATGELIGAIGLVLNKVHNHAEMGYWTGVPYWSKGYCSEAAKGVLKYAFEELSLHRVHAHYIKRNPASGRVMEKIGMTHEGILRGHVVNKGVYEDMVCYGILKKDWLK